VILNQTIFNAELSEILAELQLSLQANGIQLLQKTKETDTHIMVQCPYHKNGQEHKPSAGIRKSDGKFHCFTCNEVHDLHEVISYCFGHHDDVLGKFGWQWLVKNFATISVEVRKDVEIDVGRPNISNKSNILDNSSDNKYNYVSEKELDSYRYYHSYMYERKLTNAVIATFDIGYDKNTECLTFPVRDLNGNCLFIARRSVNTKYFNYPAGAEKPVYGLYELSLVNNVKEVIVCESMLDALTAWTYGRYAVALNGLGTKEQFRQLENLSCRKLILATDNDEAGMKARDRIRANVKGKLITEYILPKGKKDLNELTKDEFTSLEEVF
jgi:DNA primase